MWHASVAPLPGKKVREKELRRLALRHLAPVGDRAAEWAEWTGHAYHVRRRLTPAEQRLVGDAVDCRGTAEGLARLEAIRHELSAPQLLFATRELRDGP